MRVLVLTQRLPYAPNRGDRLRAFHQIRHLRAQGWTVDVLSLVHDAEEAAEAGPLRAAGARVQTAAVPHLRNKVAGLFSLPGARPLTLTLLDSPELPAAIASLTSDGLPDAILACSSGMAAIALRPPLDAVPLVIDFVDVDSEKWRALGATSRWPMSWIYGREQRTLQAFETRVARSAFISLLTTERERQALLAFAPEARAVVIPNGIDLDSFRRPAHAERSPEPRVVFTGVMNYVPNADAAVWLAREIWPQVRVKMPEARLDIVGASPSPAVQELDDQSVGVTVTGSVADVRPYLWRAHAAVAPLRVARGVQNKVLEAAAAGLPCIVTPSVSAGLPPALRSICPVAETAEALGDHLCRALDSAHEPARWTTAVAGLAWSQALAALPGLLADAACTRMPRPQ
ncbi:sugar transferase, PEP-CTERM/EpsH1 system associated [Luteitalea pratensis]|uniref:Sugar transferase, PEP-CTERM/EpsH1 system associated n=1 Tax=Luteitalea pratensis TaxID=1855912 RepID=A0A143PQH5_LUTPR|nr:TIGR03087 family PEP-CTERM/XrtA system glycosyltransferase [Luteitalea pratensis]AMY10059.1 sugar transferase, PEP-CTERM/EpsH1 system associated [Luteitalea pratensis]